MSAPPSSREPVGSFDPNELRRLRTERGLTLDGLAELTGILRPNLITYEQGNQRVGVDNLMALAKALDVEPIDLMATRLHREQATLVELRHTKGLTIVAVANHLGLGRSTWDAIERGERALKPGTLAALADLLECPPEVAAAAHERGVRRRLANSADTAGPAEA